MPAPLEQTLPAVHFRERHSRRINADPEAVWRALTRLRIDELTITRPLVAIRRLGRRDTTAAKPLFTDGPVTMFDLQPPHYAVGGAVARPWQRRPSRRDVRTRQEFDAIAEPGWVKYLVDFTVERRDGGATLSTVTCGYSTDPASRRRFAVYWAIIRIGSGLVRRDMLAAVARRAEATTSR